MSSLSNTLTQKVADLGQITSKPSLVALSYSLRHPETWPVGFVWNYRNCTQCAVGLSTQLWPEDAKKNLLSSGYNAASTREKLSILKSWIAREMAMNMRDSNKIFFDLVETKQTVIRNGWFRTKVVETVNWDAITPDDVADAIDQYLASA